MDINCTFEPIHFFLFSFDLCLYHSSFPQNSCRYIFTFWSLKWMKPGIFASFHVCVCVCVVEEGVGLRVGGGWRVQVSVDMGMFVCVCVCVCVCTRACCFSLYVFRCVVTSSVKYFFSFQNKSIDHYDVAIVGAGPAGASCAFYLSKLMWRVLQSCLAESNNNNHKILIAWKGSIRDLQSPHCTTICLEHIHCSGQGAMVYKSHTIHGALLMCNVLCGMWYEGTAQLLSLTEFESHLF